MCRDGIDVRRRVHIYSWAVTWIDGIGYVVSPVDGVNGVRPAFVRTEKRSTVAVSVSTQSDEAR
jgi:hypothetical protein